MPPGAAFPQMTVPKPRTLLEKLMPMIHLFAAWILLTYFIVWREPASFAEKALESVSGGSGSWWQRWAELAWKSPKDGWGVQAVVSVLGFSCLVFILSKLLAILLGVHHSHSFATYLENIQGSRTFFSYLLCTLSNMCYRIPYDLICSFPLPFRTFRHQYLQSSSTA